MYYKAFKLFYNEVGKVPKGSNKKAQFFLNGTICRSHLTNFEVVKCLDFSGSKQVRKRVTKFFATKMTNS